jgi:hypothetical protein
MVFHHKMSERDHIQGINNLKLFLTLFTIYYQSVRTGKGPVNFRPFLSPL